MVDFNLSEGPATISDEVACIKQQIDILFDTAPGDLLGDLYYGTNYEQYLYNLQLSPDQLSEAMLQDLYKLDLLGYTPQVQVYLMQGTERDIALIQVDLIKGGSRTTTTYTIK